MLPALLPSSYYAFYVAALAAAVRLAVLLSLLVSADRVLNVLKYGAIRLRAAVTGRRPKDDWFCAPLPADPEAHPMVSAAAAAAARRPRLASALGATKRQYTGGAAAVRAAAAGVGVSLCQGQAGLLPGAARLPHRCREAFERFLPPAPTSAACTRVPPPVPPAGGGAAAHV